MWPISHASQLFVQEVIQANNKAKHCVTGICAENLPANVGGFLAQRASSSERVPFHNAIIEYNDVIMSAMASQITGVSIVCSNVGTGPDQRKHQSSVSLASVRGMHRWQVNSSHKRPVTRKMFPFDDVIMFRIPWTSACHQPQGKGVVSQIPQCIRQISHDSPLCNRNVHTCAHFGYKNGALWVWDRYFAGFMKMVSLWPARNWRNFEGDIFKCISCMEVSEFRLMFYWNLFPRDRPVQISFFMWFLPRNLSVTSHLICTGRVKRMFDQFVYPWSRLLIWSWSWIACFYKT